MRAIRVFILVAVMLLAGCQSPKDQEKATTLDCFVPRNDEGTASMDSMENDSIRKFYERMERWEMLHGGMSRWESDK
jgi:uncharacterized lipoprotein YajG